MSQLNPSEISSVLKEKISGLDLSSEKKNEGVIVSVSDGIVRLHGMGDVMYGELIEFENGVLGFIAIFDFIWQKYQHVEKLKMTIKEVKDEHKDTDGSPEVKQKIRKLQNEIANRAATQSAALDDVKDASAVITNPTHFAVAIKYEVGSEGAPIILAMGRGMIAEKIIKLADENKVTVFQSPLLARALYFTGEIGKEISENLYSAVASVLAYIFKIERGEETDYPEFEIPENMSFDEYGKTIK